MFDLSTKPEILVYLPIYTSLLPRLFLPRGDEEMSLGTRLNLDPLMEVSEYKPLPDHMHYT